MCVGISAENSGAENKINLIFRHGGGELVRAWHQSSFDARKRIDATLI